MNVRQERWGTWLTIDDGTQFAHARCLVKWLDEQGLRPGIEVDTV